MRLRWFLFLPLLFALTTTVSAEESNAPAPNAARIQVGQEAPAFTLESSAGENYSLEQLRGEKNLVVVFFRGTW